MCLVVKNVKVWLISIIIKCGNLWPKNSKSKPQSIDDYRKRVVLMFNKQVLHKVINVS
jgi:hypothetical protein